MQLEIKHLHAELGLTVVFVTHDQGFVFIWPIVSLLSISVLEPQPTLENYEKVVTNPVYARVLLRTLWIAVLVSACRWCSRIQSPSQ